MSERLALAWGAVDHAPFGIALYGLDGTLRHLNRRGADLFAAAGQPPRDELIGHPWVRLFPHLTGTDFERGFRELSAPAVRPGGTRVLPGFQGLLRYHVVLTRADPETVAVYFTEVAELAAALAAAEAAEGRARRSQEELAWIKASYPFGAMAVLDADFRYLEATGQGWIRQGIDPGTVVGRTLRERWDPETAERMEELVGVGLRGFQAEQRVPFGDQIFEIWAGPLETDGDEPRCLIVSKEVTERVAREEEVRLLEEATDAVSMGVILADLAGDDQPVVYASRGFSRLTGYPPTEVLGRNCRFLQGPDTDVLTVRDIREAILQRRPFQGVLLNYRKDGTPFWNRLTLSPFSRSGGGPTHYVGIQEDVTEIREAEMGREHQRRLAELGTLAGSIAHDFNNILMEIQGRVAMVEGEPVPATVSLELAGVREAARSGSHLVAQLLAYARHQRSRTEDAGGVALLRDAVPAVARLLPRNVRVELVHPEDPVPIRLAPVQLEQILLNLAKNAADAMPQGGRLGIHLAPEPEDPGWMVLTVSDTGSGMPPEVLERAFEPFFTTKGSGGTGLGLSSVAQIVERAGGRLELESRVGSGTTFRIYLPAGDPAELPTQPPERNHRASAPGIAGLRVLLAEDQSGIRDIVARILTREGARVVVAPDGADALRHFRSEAAPPDLVLVDRDMPHVSGDRVIREITASIPPGTEDPWFVLMSGDFTTEIHGLPAHTLLVQKPFEIHELLQLLQDLVTGTARPGEP